jgi:hypothetical protein
LAFVAPLHFQEDRISRTESTFYPQLAANQSFAASTRSKASFSPLTLMSLVLYPQPQRNEHLGQPHPAQQIDSKPLAPNISILSIIPRATT